MTAAVLLSMGSAVSFGFADFLGGIASRRAHVLPVTLISQAIGLVIVLAVIPFTPGQLSRPAIAWGMVAGVGGAIGLIAYFRALSIGAMGLTAPVASLTCAAIPVIVGLGLGERPAATAAAGIVLGIGATVLVSRPAADTATDPTTDGSKGLLMALVSGLLFGVFFVALDQAPGDSGLWPLVGARVLGLLLLTGLLALQRPPWPQNGIAGIATMSGLLDMAANVLFLLATRQGLLVLTAVVSGLYPVAVVVLAWLFLKERLGRTQQAGVGLALAAAALIAL
ncbi:DMT family transporter [soil metagenome]